jgi:hypothetical protein
MSSTCASYSFDKAGKQGYAMTTKKPELPIGPFT